MCRTASRNLANTVRLSSGTVGRLRPTSGIWFLRRLSIVVIADWLFSIANITRCNGRRRFRTSFRIRREGSTRIGMRQSIQIEQLGKSIDLFYISAIFFSSRSAQVEIPRCIKGMLYSFVTDGVRCLRICISIHGSWTRKKYVSRLHYTWNYWWNDWKRSLNLNMETKTSQFHRHVMDAISLFFSKKSQFLGIFVYRKFYVEYLCEVIFLL